MKQSMGFSKRAAGGAMGAAGGQGLPGPAASVPPPGLPRCPRSAPVLPWFSPNSVFTSFPSFPVLEREASSEPGFCQARWWPVGLSPPGHLIVPQPCGSPVPATGTLLFLKHPSGLISTSAQSTPLRRCTRSMGVPQCSPLGWVAQWGPTSPGAPRRNISRKPVPGEGPAPSRPSPASHTEPERAVQPGFASAFDKGALSNKG